MKNVVWPLGNFKLRFSILLWASLCGIIAGTLKIVENEVYVGNLGLEVFSGLIAILFLGCGIWIARQFPAKRQMESVAEPIQSKVENIVLPETESKILADTENLSKRELEVVMLLIEGHSNREMADLLFVSENTIKKHLSGIFSKLGVNRRTQVIARVRQMGIISEQSEKTL